MFSIRDKKYLENNYLQISRQMIRFENCNF